MPQKVVTVEVECPVCGDLNRAARRACRTCKRTGKVTKNVPILEGEN